MIIKTRILPFILANFVLTSAAYTQEPANTPHPHSAPAPAPVPLKNFSRHAVIMLAINYSEGEVNAAKSAAEARGEQFILIPEMTAGKLKNSQHAYDAETYSHRVVDPLSELISAAQGKQRKILEKRMVVAEKKLTEMQTKIIYEKQPDLNKLLTRKIRELAKAGVGVDSLVISAHDGGGNFAGNLGHTSTVEIAEIAKTNPQFKNDLRSVFMMGCYTATTDQVRDWRKAFPQMELVAGYDQSAPLRDAPKGWNYIHDTMVLQKEMTEAKDKNALSGVASRITDLNKSWASFATFPVCKDPSKQVEFYRGKITHYQVDELDPKFCEKAAPEFEKNQKIYDQYAKGELPLPENTGNSPLRELYTFYRNHEICYSMQEATGPNANEVFFLLFNQAVRANFVKYFKEALDKMTNAYQKLNIQTAKSNSEKLLNALHQKSSRAALSKVEEKQVKDAKEFLTFMNKKPDPDTTFRSDMAKLMDPLKLRGLSMKDLGDIAEHFEAAHSLTYLASAVSNTLTTTTPLRAGIEKIGNDFNTFVVARTCLPMSWHEEAKGKPEAPGHCDE